MRPSVEFSSGTTPKSACLRSTSSNTAAMRADADVLDRLAEPLEGGEVAVAVLRAEERDLAAPSAPPASREISSRKIALSVTSCERPLVRVEDVVEDFFLAGGGEDLAALVGLHLADLRRRSRPAC